MVQERDFLGSADGATAPESLRQKDPETMTIWREANHRFAHRRGPHLLWNKLSGNRTDGV